MSERANRTGLFELLQSPELADLIRVAIRNERLDARTHSVCSVVKYNPATQQVDVLVDQRSRIKDPNVATDPNATHLQKPMPLMGLPVAWPRTGAGYLTFPIVPGDKGELHVQDRSLEGYVPTGLPSEPARKWTHNLADSIFHPMLVTETKPIVPPTSIVATVLEGPLIKLGALAVEPIMKSPLWVAYVTTVDAAFTAWTDAQPDPTSASNTIFIGAMASANKVLFTSLPTPGSWVSPKVTAE